MVSRYLLVKNYSSMEGMQPNTLLKLPPDAVHKIRNLYNYDTPERLKESLDLLEEWIRKQTHFVKRDFPRDYLERTLLTCKGSVEKAKKQLDRLCTVKTVLPKFFTMTNVSVELKHVTELAGIIPLPNVTADFYRVVILKFFEKDLEPRNFLEFYQYVIIMCEYMKRHDYVNGFVVIEDFRNINIFDFMTKLNSMELQHMMTILTEAYGARLKNIYLLSESKAIELLINFIKQFLSHKISSRVHVISNFEQLHSVVPKMILPKDYGGFEKSSNEIIQEWVDALSSEDHVEYMKMMNKACTNESLRLEGKFNEDYMGMPGSFRNLNVD